VDKSMSEEEVAAISAMIHKYVYTDRPFENADPAIRAGAMRVNANARLNMTSVEDQLAGFRSESLVPQTATLETLVDGQYVETY
jgi:NitT/TauT family transport system substrate-binding protein